MSKRVALYIRVSTEEQANSGYSLPEQRRTLEQYAERLGWQIIDVVADEGDSGANPNRSGLLRILELAETGAIDAALAWRRDRWFRDIFLRRGFEQDLYEYGVNLLALNDTGNPITDGMIDLLGEEERKEIAERTRKGKLGKARVGKLPGGNQVHFGFRFLGDTAEEYEVDPSKIILVERIFRMVGDEGRSLTAVKTAFEREEIPTPRGARWWNISTIKRIIENDVYLARSYEEVAALVSPEAAAKLDQSERYGIYWFGRVRMRRNYRTRLGGTKFTVERNAREEWVAIPVPDSGIPPEWVQAARERIANNVQWSPYTSPDVRLRGRIKCACGYAMTNIQSDGRRYYVCSQHRKRGRCKHIRFHRLGETEERVERFVLGLLRDPETLRSKVEEKAERERRVLQNTDREAGRIRSRLAKLATMEKAYSKQEAEGLVSSDTLRANLDDLDQERTDLERRLAELADSERRLRELEALPSLVEEYLREVPHLLDLKPLLREYETSAPEATPDDPLGAIYTITPERIRFLPEEELAEKRRAVEEKRARRFRELYEMLGLKVVCHKDRSLEVSWGAHCSEWLGREVKAVWRAFGGGSGFAQVIWFVNRSNYKPPSCELQDTRR